jgi:pyrimidine 5'-nucleotidase
MEGKIMTEGAMVEETRKSVWFTLPLVASALIGMNQVKPIGDSPILIFDIDNTLYNDSCGFDEHMRDKILEYMREVLNMSPKDAEETCDRCHKAYGLSIKGLVVEGKITSRDHLDRWHEIFDKRLNIDGYLKEDEDLKILLDGLKERKWCLTNGTLSHAERILRKLGVRECFEGIIYCEYTLDGKFVCKPDPRACKFVEKLFKVEDGDARGKLIFFDDKEDNVKAATQRGWRGYYVKDNLKNYLIEYSNRDESSSPTER